MDTEHDEHRTPPPQKPRAVDRRGFLKRSGVSLAGLSLLSGSSGTSLAADHAAPTEVVFTFSPDESGTVQALIDAFNREYAGDIQVRWRTMPASSDAYFQQLASDFESGSPDVDVIGADVVWTAELARHGWVTDLSQRFHREYDPDDFLYEALGSASHQFRIWGVPWYTDAGMLFYRRDLLMRNDFTHPPTTWDELKRMAQVVLQNNNVLHGFVFQGDAYEGGVTNACEYIWNAGGRIMTQSARLASEPGGTIQPPNVVNVDTPEAARGLNVARSLITDGVAPAEVTSFREQDAMALFLGGDAMFMRNWPIAYGLVYDDSISRLDPEQIGITTIPTADANRPHYSCLGGWNLMISAMSSPEKQDAAWRFIRFATAGRQQKDRALAGGFLPSLRALYDDPEVEGAIPVVDLGREAIRSARSRPSSPYYSQMSPRIAEAFTSTLRGDHSGEEAAHQLAADLRAILRHGG